MGLNGLKKGLSSIINSVSGKFWVEQMIDEAVDRGSKSPQITEFFHPSWSGQCPRLIQLNMFNLVKSEVDNRVQRIFDNGNSTHERYVKYFSRIKKMVGNEVSFEFKYKDITISGRADIIVKDYNDEKHIGEMKTINNRRFTEVLIANSPLEEHFLQWNIYSFGLKIHNGFVLYENKDDQRLLIFPVTFDEDRFTRVMNKFVFIDSCSRQGKLVPQPEPCPDGRYCIARSFCASSDIKTFNDAIKDIILKRLEKSG